MADRLILQLEGHVVAELVSAFGGAAEREVVANPNAPGGVVRKSPGKLSYDPIILQIGGATTKAVFQWIADTWAHHGSKKSGVIIKVNAAGKDAGRLEFTNALLTEITLPAFDATLRDPATMRLKLQPASTVRKLGTGADLGIPPVPAKAWLLPNFRLTIDGIDTTKTVRIGALTVAVATTPAPDGSVNPGSIAVSSLAVTFPEITAAGFLSWLQSFVIDGHNDPSQEKTATVAMLSPNLQEVFLTFTLHNIGIFRLDAIPPDPPGPAGTGGVSQMLARMYVNQPDLAFPP
jgi:phage tail-like protein